MSDDECDDQNNIAECHWDGGDCCSAINTQYCEYCKCLDPDFEENGMCIVYVHCTYVIGISVL
jgi:hypothetical protein